MLPAAVPSASASADPAPPLIPPELVWWLMTATRENCQKFYAEIWKLNQWPVIAELARKDRFFLLTHILNRLDADRDWIYARCREVEQERYGYLDLWARFHYKSTLITLAGTIQEIIENPEITIAIFSHNNKTARAFLAQIKRELEDNVRLKECFPNIFHRRPDKESPRWSEERGIIVKRRGNPKEATVEAHGLVDGMPTGAHYKLRIYDDVVTQESVTTPEMMAKTTEAWELSCFLGSEEGLVQYVGTRYHFNDTYRTMLDRGTAKLRRRTATIDGRATGDPVLLTRERMDELRRNLGPFVIACQLFLDPVSDAAQGFKREWLRHAERLDHKGMNVYILVDPANEKKNTSDFTAMAVVGLSSDGNYYVLDWVRDRINLTERADQLFDLHKAYKPLIVGYEKYGMQSDVQHFQDRMRRENYRFGIQELAGQVKKEDRIRKLIPLFEQGRIWMPEALFRTSDNRKVDLVKAFIEDEYLAFPVGLHDDMLDCLARILDPDMPLIWPKQGLSERERKRRGDYDFGPPKRRTTWMAA